MITDYRENAFRIGLAKKEFVQEVSKCMIRATALNEEEGSPCLSMNSSRLTALIRHGNPATLQLSQLANDSKSLAYQNAPELAHYRDAPRHDS